VTRHPYEAQQHRAPLEPACVGEDPNLFVPPYMEDDRAGRVAKAVAICSRCPIQDRCLIDAIKRHDHGVWGGIMLEAGRPAQGQPSGKPVKPAPECGSIRAYHRHYRLGEPIDERCRAAKRAYDVRRYKRTAA
jgi:WhiB family transcriptional regulator, redox-sensing transcriptional regulator